MEPLRVLHIIGGGEFGGAERHILNLSGALNPKAVEITVCCLFNEPFAEIAASAGIRSLAFPMRHKADLGVIGKLAALILNNGYEIVHTHGVRANLLGRLAARQAGRKKVVTTVHSLLEKDYPGFFYRLANSITERLTRSLTDHFITVSGGLKERLVSQGVPEEKITIIYNGIVVEEFNPGPQNGNIHRKFGLDAAAPLVGIVARLHPVKGHRFFLEAAREVLQQRPDVHFLVIGDGPLRPYLEELAAQLGIAGRVIFTGFIEDIPATMSELELLVISSLWEGFGLTAVEAMALDVPVISTETGGLPEVILHGETGLLVPPANSTALARGIIWMLDHPGAVAEMTLRAGVAVREKFTAAVMARRTEELYRRLAGCRP
ncbi:MAG: Alpha-D-kanosaminyltransferase [Firmicutes bacterium ADurb.Bin456]|nr:MAG: Alpha-D-kanosaminyltransferase [Firmicutes bacterium ADurb.Bin456]